MLKTSVSPSSIFSPPFFCPLLAFVSTGQYEFALSHASKDMISSHCIQFDFDKPLPSKSLTLPQSHNNCKSPFKIFDDTAAHMPTEDDFKTLFGDLSLKFYLYMGHTILFINQNTAIKDLMEKLDGDSSISVVVMEFKMKFEMMKHRDNSVENFVKRGLSWHGALVFCSIWVYDDTGVYEMRQLPMYINHINVLDN